MKLLTDEQAIRWAATVGLTLPKHAPLQTRPKYGESEATIRVRVPAQASAAIGLAYIVAITGVENFSEENFVSSILWLQRWELWSESIDRVGYLLLESLRGTDINDLAHRPVHQCEPGEFTLAHTLLSIPVLMQWDARYVGGEGAYVADISHEGWIDVTFRNKDVSDDLVKRLKERNVELEPARV